MTLCTVKTFDFMGTKVLGLTMTNMFLDTWMHGFSNNIWNYFNEYIIYFVGIFVICRLLGSTKLHEFKCSMNKQCFKVYYLYTLHTCVLLYLVSLKLALFYCFSKYKQQTNSNFFNWFLFWFRLQGLLFLKFIIDGKNNIKVS